MSSYENEAPSGDVSDNNYVSRSGHKGEEIPVMSDQDIVEDGLKGDQDTDAQLERDDIEAIDKSNIVDGRTRGAKPTGGYREPGDEEGLPSNDGTSSADVKVPE
ncbi:hypothetical protein F5Y15DRAFT_429322 [Xylariaceae sp. FL0016]|nr:hypothetical protein F5Y15DRAFT_429322 [Xylariaceae sp. FL0016]